MTKSSLIPLYFAPDLDPSWEVNPGVLTEVRNMVPTSRGTYVNYVCSDSEDMDSFAPYTDASFTTNGDAVVSAAIARCASGSSSDNSRLIVGTYYKLYDTGATSGGLTTLKDCSRTTGGNYNSSEWVFDNYGNKIVATEWHGDSSTAIGTPQTSTGPVGTRFGNLTTSAPRAQLCCVQKGMLLLANVADASTAIADGWMCSGLYNVNSWTTLGGAANLTTQANNGRLLETPGPICALVKQRDYVVAYKPSSIYIGQYTGNPYGWSWRLVTNEVGQSTPNGVAVVNGVHYFLHSSGVYAFDGSYPKNIGTGVVNRYVQKLMSSDANWDKAIRAVVDDRAGLIYWFFGSYDGGQFGDLPAGVTSYLGPFGLVYNYISNKFGFISRPTEDIVTTFVPVNSTRAQLRTWKLAFSSDIRQDTLAMLSVCKKGDNVYLRSPRLGSAANEGNYQAFVITGDIGSEQAFTKVLRVQPSFVEADDDDNSAECYVDSKNTKADDYDGLGYVLEGTATSTGATSSLRGTMVRADSVDNHTVAADDYLTFDVKMESGSILTPVGFYCTTSSPTTTAIATGTVSALNEWTTISTSIGSLSGDVITAYRPYMGVPGATGLHRVVYRNIKITDSSGALRRRLCKGNEVRYTYTMVATNYDNPKAYIRQSHGTAYTYDTNKRRWDGSKTGKVHRIKMGFYNGTEIDGVYLTTQTVGSE